MSAKGRASADLDTQLMQLKHCDGEERRAITKMPYKKKESLAVILCFMSRSALAECYNKKHGSWRF